MTEEKTIQGILKNIVNNDIERKKNISFLWKLSNNFDIDGFLSAKKPSIESVISSSCSQ